MKITDHLRLAFPDRHYSAFGDEITFDDGQPMPSQDELAATYDAAFTAWQAEQQAANVKVWPSAQELVEEWSLEECAAISLSPHPHIAALRLKLQTWQGEIHADHDLVRLGFTALVDAGIMSQERADAIRGL